MAAAYAAIVSLMHIIEQSMEHHARQPIFLDKQWRQIEILQEKVSFLQDFLEVYSHGGRNETEGLASRIADAAYDAEDIIESHIVDTILLENGSNNFSQSLQQVIEAVDCIRKEVMEVKENSSVDDQQPRDPVPVVSSRSIPSPKVTMVEYDDDDLEQIMDKLTGQSSNLQTIPIVGMGGIGKTTFARSVFDNPLIVEYFYIRAWVTISQEYSLQETLLHLLHETEAISDKRNYVNSEYHELGEKLYKHLSGRKYLIILDDIWSIEVCEKLTLFFPDNNNGSRVVLTTRLSSVADSFGSFHPCKMNLLDENKSWSLLCRIVFGHEDNCPSELAEIGKDIAKNCKGLPLSIVVVAGLLVKSDMTQIYWEYVARDINQIVNSEDNGYWLEILSLSYNHLPIHLKPCFLYMGVYREDHEIHISKLIKLWIAEGFLKPNKAKSLEEVAEDYLKELIERNLISVSKWGSIGKMKTCSIHDLLRDLCLKKGQEERFLCVVKPQNHAQSMNNERRIVSHINWSCDHPPPQTLRALQSSALIRSLTCYHVWNSSWESAHNLRLLRVLDITLAHSLNSILQRVNLRFLSCGFFGIRRHNFPLTCQLWNLQTLILRGFSPRIVITNEIWEMPQLRHIIATPGIWFGDPLGGRMDGFSDLLHGRMNGQEKSVLGNLQPLLCVRNFKCTEEVFKRIPNIKKLKIESTNPSEDSESLHNLGSLHKLQSLSCISFKYTDFIRNIVFPVSLKKLELESCCFYWDDITIKVGSLPHLEKLKLSYRDGGAEWNTVEGKFLLLKFLEISWGCLVCWTAEDTHFPLLERLVLRSMRKLKEIPSGIGETLQSIELVNCRDSAVASAKKILEEQQSLGNEGLRLIVRGYRDTTFGISNNMNFQM